MKKIIFRFNVEDANGEDMKKIVKVYNDKNVLFMSDSFDLIQIDDETGEVKKF